MREKCPCDCSCKNRDEYTKQGFTCEDCFADCVTMIERVG